MIRRVGAIVLLSASVATFAPLGASAAQDLRDGWWEIRVNGSVEIFDRQLSPWHWHTISAELRDSTGSTMFSAYATRRFGLSDQGASIDFTHTLWRRAYGSIRLAGAAAAQVIARSDVSAELFQGFGRGWEVSPSVRRMRFGIGTVPIYGIGVGKYSGNWYLRGRGSMTQLSGTRGTSVSAMARRFFATASNFAEFGAGAGFEAEIIDRFGGTLVRRVSFASLRGQKMLRSDWGVSTGLSVNVDEALPRRTGMSIAVFNRR